MWKWNKTAPTRDDANSTYGSPDINTDEAQAIDVRPIFKSIGFRW